MKILIFFGVVLFFLVLREAILIPLTHDEYSTIMVSYQSVWDIITYKDPVPNNHILNTLLLKLNILTFGDHLFSNRLHNVLAFIPYFVFGVLLAKRITSSFILQCTLLCMMTLQPFLLDFFCVTRGYGLGLTFQMISLYYTIYYIQEYKTSHLNISIIMAAFAVLANFTLLNYFLPLCGLILFYSFRENYKTDFRKFRTDFISVLGISFLLGLCCYLPFSKMVSTNQFVFWSSNNFFSDTIVPLFHSLKIGVTYFKWNDTIFSLVFLGLILVLGLSLIVLLGKSVFKDKYVQCSALLLLLVLVYNNLQFYIFKIPFLNARTSLFLIPLVALFIFSLVQVLYNSTKKAGSILSVVLILLCSQHFVRGYNGRVNYEWYFNQNTYEVIDELMFQINSNNLVKPVVLDCHWFYHPSFTYHINQKYRGIIELLPYHKETNANSNAIFYYSEPNEADTLSKNFIKIKEFSSTQSILWKRK